MDSGSISLNDFAVSLAPKDVGAVGKALRLLLAFSRDHPCRSLSELSRTVRVPKSTAYNLLKTLERYQFVQQDPESLKYRLGARLYELGMLFYGQSEFIPKALPFLRRLAHQTDETVKLGILSGGRVLVVAAVESTHQLHTRGDVGSSWPLHSTSLGKAILSRLPAAERSRTLHEQGLPRLTSRTITTLERIEQAIGEIHQKGFALDLEENEEGVCCIAVPVPVLIAGAPAAISISGPSIRLTRFKMEQWAPLLAATAEDVAGAVMLRAPRHRQRVSTRIAARRTSAGRGEARV